MTVEILIGDVIDRLRDLPDESVDCVVTSPPYWGLRDYGVAGQLGMEPTLGEHLAAMVRVFAEVRRVLKPTGTCWVNYGDCYATAPNGRSAADSKAAGTDDRTFRDKPFSTVGAVNPSACGGGGDRANVRPAASMPPVLGSWRDPAVFYGEDSGPTYVPDYAKTVRGAWHNSDTGYSRVEAAGRVVSGGYLKPKDLCMLPNRLAIALQDDGWWVRSEIVWGKPNAMPDSSGKFRPSTAHEKIFLLTKSADAEVWVARDTGEMSFGPDLTERAALVTRPDQDGPRWIRLGAYYDAGAVKLTRATPSDGKAPDGWDTGAGGHGSFHRSGREKGAKSAKRGGQPVAVSPRHEGHIDHTGIDATPRGEGRLLRNYETWDALAELVPPDVLGWEIAIQGFSGAHFATFPPALVVPCVLAGCPAGGTVLDPFGGAGTTGLVADRLGREAILIELNPAYAQIARSRLRAELCRVTSDLPEPARDDGALFGVSEVAA